MENIIDIYNLLPEEIDNAIEKLSNALKIIKHWKNTNSKFIDKEKKGLVRPFCGSVKTAARMQCNKITVFLLRHKVLECLSSIRKNTKLEGKTEAEEIYKSINLKGTKPEKMPRKSKKVHLKVVQKEG